MKAKKIMSLALAATLMFSANMTTFAATSKPDESERPVESVTASVDGLTAITVGTTAADIEKDVNFGGVTEDQIYARAELADTTEYDLRHETVTIVTSKDVKWQGKSLSSTNGVYTVDDVDLFNKYYNVTVGDTTVRLAAGLPAEGISISADDPLAATDLSFGEVEVGLTATNTANEFYANDYYEYPSEDWAWTSIVYQFKADSAVPSSTGSMTVANKATITGCVTGTGTGESADYTFDLSGTNPSFIVTDEDGNSRTYYVAATLASTGISVTYAINLHEVVSDSAYATEFANNCAGILDGAEGYFNSVNAKNVTKTNESVSAVITIAAGTDAMQPMLDLTEWATDNGYFDDGDTRNDGTYLAELNGLGEFDCGQLSGWMYTTDPAGYSATCTGPNVGAASYTMTNGETITWYMTSNYFNHF